MKIVRRSPEPFFYKGGKTGILLIHGFSGSPSELRPMGQYFIDKGYTVYAPLLAGHGKTAEEMVKTGWRDWWQSVLDAYERLQKEELDHLFVAGLSMGGALTLFLAAQKPVDGVISMCTPVWIKDRRLMFVDLVHYFYPFYTPKNRRKRDPEIESMMVPIDRTPLKCVASLKKFIRTQMRPSLSKVTVPALIVQSRQDETVEPESADYILEHISSEKKKLSWYENSCHIITLDKERGKLFQEVEHFIIENSMSIKGLA
ncbi:alpha/beta hydrolase [Thermoflavimicrobium dichotomicum]|uniref:Carboxylesterase n=1 Tax=Thermoflavimicrobium dichotomicum TaxID=46223 RepID=A0A1I3JQH9_9BACL|nr:alpha/beta fold hydrolase [Thermoflavimicrobium dichotomicum]SFI62268.1 carboxylesterase [Thermoflavimicrobium dichotomicum]